MIYLKKFETEDNYLTYRDGSSYLKPNVSLCKGNSMVYYNYPPPIVYEAVDLGLPTGTKWATQNVGARKPSDVGLYFAWGDTQGYTADQIGTGEGKKKFSWSDYKWNPSGDGKTFTKYASEGESLELEDDAAHANMGGSWHMPSPEQIQELLNTAYTTTAWTTSDGVSGMTFTSKKDSSKSIFIPAAGDAWDGKVDVRGSFGLVWSSMLSSSNVSGAQYLFFGSGGAGLRGSGNRRDGLSVRGVLG